MPLALLADAATTPADAVWFAAGGGLTACLLPLLELANVPPAERPNFKSVFYWLPFALLPLLGGGLAYAYVRSGVDLKPIVAVNIGLTAPLILRAMASAPPAAAGVKTPAVGVPTKPGQ